MEHFLPILHFIDVRNVINLYFLVDIRLDSVSKLGFIPPFLFYCINHLSIQGEQTDCHVVKNVFAQIGFLTFSKTVRNNNSNKCICILIQYKAHIHPRAFKYNSLVCIVHWSRIRVGDDVDYQVRRDLLKRKKIV